MDFIKRNSLLYKTGVEYGDYTINHIEGCSHGCTYPCYAMRMSYRFGRIKSYSDWLKPKLVENALELLQEEIPKLKSKIRSVHLCFMSDPFMHSHNEVAEMSLKIIKLLNINGIKVTTLTKGIYPRNLFEFAINPVNEYGITLVSLNPNFQRKFEPFSAKWFQRVRSLERLSGKGAKTWVSMEPYPTPNIIKQNLGQILDRVAFTNRIVFGRLNYNSNSTKYADHVKFYNDLCFQVLEFCQKNGIACHIKKGTYTRPDFAMADSDLKLVHQIYLNVPNDAVSAIR
jgi:DNA repair photolyase